MVYVHQKTVDNDWTITKSNPLCLLMVYDPFVQMSYLPLLERDALSSIQITVWTWENIGLSFIFQSETNQQNTSIPWVEHLGSIIRVSSRYWLLTDLDTNNYVTDCKLWGFWRVWTILYLLRRATQTGPWHGDFRIHRYNENGEFVNIVFEQSKLPRKG